MGDIQETAVTKLVDGIRGIVDQAVEQAISDVDFTDLACDAVKDLSAEDLGLSDKARDALDDAVSSYDFDEKISEAIDEVDLEDKINDAIRDVDFDQKVEEAIDNCEQAFHDKIEEGIKNVSLTEWDEFNSLDANMKDVITWVSELRERMDNALRTNEAREDIGTLSEKVARYKTVLDAQDKRIAELEWMAKAMCDSLIKLGSLLKDRIYSEEVQL